MTLTPARTKPVILIIDDTKLVVQILERTLSKQGYEVIKAHNGKDGFDLAITKNPDLILLDVIMPGENGFDVIQKLKQNSESSKIPVIFLTANNDIRSKITGFDYGAVDFITKPFEVQEVEVRVRTHLKLSQALNALVASQAQKLKEIQEAQNALLITPPELPNAHFSVYYSSLMEAGGDFYDVLEISDDIFGYFAGDVSGHSIKTSFLTSSLKALLKQNSSPIYSPSETLNMMNNVLLHILQDSNYLTATYIRINRRTMEAHIICAAHPPVLYIPVKGEAQLIELSGDLLGLFEDAVFGNTHFTVYPGDRFYLYTDGLIESVSGQELWTTGISKLLDLAPEIKNLDLDSSVKMMVSRLVDSDKAAEDDVLLLGFQV